MTVKLYLALVLWSSLFRSVTSQNNEPNLATSSIDDTMAEGSVAWPLNSPGLMAPYPLMPWSWRQLRRVKNGRTCGNIPIVLGGHVDSASYRYQSTFAVPFDTVKYACSEDHFIDGWEDITCLPNGKWSKPPQCLPLGIYQELMKNAPAVADESSSDIVWLTSSDRRADEILWPDWFTTIERQPSTATTVGPLSSTTENSVERLLPFILRLEFDLSQLFRFTAPPDETPETTTTAKTTTSSSSFWDNQAILIGVVLGAFFFVVLLFGLVVFFFIRYIKRLGFARAISARSRSRRSAIARSRTAQSAARSESKSGNNQVRPEDEAEDPQHPNMVPVSNRSVSVTEASASPMPPPPYENRRLP